MQKANIIKTFKTHTYHRYKIDFSYIMLLYIKSFDVFQSVSPILSFQSDKDEWPVLKNKMSWMVLLMSIIKYKRRKYDVWAAFQKVYCRFWGQYGMQLFWECWASTATLFIARQKSINKEQIISATNQPSFPTANTGKKYQ